MKTYSLADVKAIKARDMSAPHQFYAELDVSLMETAFRLALTTQPDAREYVQVCGCTAHLTAAERKASQQRPCPHHGGYTFELYGPTRCDGGHVLYRFTYPGQRDSIYVGLLDVAIRDWYLADPNLRAPIHRFAEVRQRLLSPPTVNA